MESADTVERAAQVCGFMAFSPPKQLSASSLTCSVLGKSCFPFVKEVLHFSWAVPCPGCGQSRYSWGLAEGPQVTSNI